MLPPNPDETEGVWFSVAAADAWQRKINARDNQFVTPLEHNSAMVSLTRLLDTFAHPGETSTAQAQAQGGYRFAEYYGPDAPEYNGRTVPLVGLFDPPEEPERRVFWQAIAELLERLGARYHREQSTAPTPAVDPASLQFVQVTNIGATAVIPMRDQSQGLWIREDPDAVRRAPEMIAGALNYGQRLALIAMGVTREGIQTASAAEMSIRPYMEQVADQYRQQQRMARNGTWGVAALEIVGGTLGRLLAR